jgi:hypothetical protein
MENKRTKKKTSKLTPKEKFFHFSGIRVKKLLRLMKSVGNLSNTRYYEYTPTQKNQILKAIRSGYSEMIRQWEKKPKIATADVKKTFWDDINNNT